MKSLIKHLGLVLLLGAVVTGQLNAQRVAAQKKGEDGEGAFAADGLDSVNLFNGGLTVEIPLGPEYPIGPDLQLQLGATYVSNIWDNELTNCTQGPYSLPVPDKRYTAGPGWTISMGRLEKSPLHWTYHAPGGSQTGLYSSLHPGSPTANGVFYSNNSTYFRLRHFPAGSASCSSSGDCVLLDKPRQITEEYHPRSIDGKTVYMPTRISDPHGNWIAISYPANGSWSIADSHGRAHSITFFGLAGQYERVNQVRLAKAGDGQGIYQFAYTPMTIDRQGFVPALCSNMSATVNVDMLASITFPDQSFYGMAYTDDDDLAGDVLSGALKSFRHRAGGETRYTYRKVLIASQPPPESDMLPGPNLPDYSAANGVRTKELALTVGGLAIGTWNYDYIADFCTGQQIPCQRRTIVTTPNGDQSVHYYSVNTTQARWTYGLPFSQWTSGSFDATPPFFSFEEYDGTVATGTLVKSVSVEYTSDSLRLTGTNAQDYNQRLIRSVTTFPTDGNATRTEVYSDFDGLGNYRTTTTTSTTGEVRTSFTNFNPSSGTLVVEPETGSTTGSTFVLPAVTDPWHLNTFDTRTETHNGVTSTQEYCFAASTGFLERIRTRKSASRGANDLVTVLTPSTEGFAATEAFYGGDAQTVNTGALCSLTLPAEASYQSNHTYHGGELQNSIAVDPCGDPVVTLLDQTIDTNTGLAVISRDSAGVATAAEFDAEGRLIRTLLVDTASAIYEYQVPTAASPGLVPRLTVLECPAGTTSCTAAAAFSWKRFEYDGLGRIVTDRVRYPDNGVKEDTLSRTFNAQGWILTESVWGASNATTYQDHDRYGRPGKVTQPDGTVVNLTYQGERVKITESKVRMTAGVTSVFKTEIYNAFGQLVRLCEGATSSWTGTCRAANSGLGNRPQSRSPPAWILLCTRQ